MESVVPKEPQPALISAAPRCSADFIQGRKISLSLNNLASISAGVFDLIPAYYFTLNALK